MRRSNAPTLQDVAAQAGVTAVVASVVLNGARSSTRASAKTRARIIEAAQRLNYRPNALARGLSRRLADTIGLVATVDVGPDVNVYFLEILNGILAAAAERNHNVTVFSISDWQQDEERILSFFDGRVDGLIFLGPYNTNASLANRLPPHAPCVMIHGSNRLGEIDNVDIDSESGSQAMTRRLIDLGHRRIAHYTGDPEVLGARQRLVGYARGLRSARIPLDRKLVFRGDFNVESGRACAVEMLSRLNASELPTAVFCSSDAIASGCIEELASRGIRVPDDMSVAGFDDTLTARMIRPALTTVRQPFRAMGRRAVELLLARIRSDSV